MTAPAQPEQPLRQRLETALRTAAHVCEDTCEPTYECAEQYPIEGTLRLGKVDEVRGPVDALALLLGAARAGTRSDGNQP